MKQFSERGVVCLLLTNRQQSNTNRRSTITTKSLAVFVAVLVASVMTTEPVLAQEALNTALGGANTGIRALWPNILLIINGIVGIGLGVGVIAFLSVGGLRNEDTMRRVAPYAMSVVIILICLNFIPPIFGLGG